MTSNHKEHCLKALGKGFVASCQPVDNGPMDKPEIVAAMAEASVCGGATALRIEGLENLKAVRTKVNVPIIGIIKRDLADSPIRITPFIEDIHALKDAGADIIAIDATHRVRPESIENLVKEIQSLGCLAMADCSNFEEGKYSESIGVEIIGTTMSGYVGDETPTEPDFELVTRLAQSGCLVMAEGRYNSPELAQKAIKAGAYSVTVGSAITRIEHICGWFKESVNHGRKSVEGKNHE
ncbi:N-acetylmannosamine-6-phosphate 2-epimerase [Vibrio rumoiensis]|uniref:Putative N-acetylmannosamine-6-phosphate 2-epimerase n=1 Tax=Vibrio rumoiensis TaxID=76258 RepID=A0ABW7IZH7_9VIBR|nr:N-acetylmannosamine-6-phosphate 2-epimerase [Vibrio rumoiensis]